MTASQSKPDQKEHDAQLAAMHAAIARGIADAGRTRLASDRCAD